MVKDHYGKPVLGDIAKAEAALEEALTAVDKAQQLVAERQMDLTRAQALGDRPTCGKRFNGGTPCYNRAQWTAMLPYRPLTALHVCTTHVTWACDSLAGADPEGEPGVLVARWNAQMLKRGPVEIVRGPEK